MQAFAKCLHAYFGMYDEESMVRRRMVDSGLAYSRRGWVRTYTIAAWAFIVAQQRSKDKIQEMFQIDRTSLAFEEEQQALRVEVDRTCSSPALFIEAVAKYMPDVASVRVRSRARSGSPRTHARTSAGEQEAARSVRHAQRLVRVHRPAAPRGPHRAHGDQASVEARGQGWWRWGLAGPGLTAAGVQVIVTVQKMEFELKEPILIGPEGKRLKESPNFFPFKPIADEEFATISPRLSARDRRVCVAVCCAQVASAR
jgi:hypothetical protein